MSSTPEDAPSHSHDSKHKSKSKRKNNIKNKSSSKSLSNTASSTSKLTQHRKHKHRSHKPHTRDPSSKHQESATHHRLEDDLPHLHRHRYFIRHIQTSLSKHAKHNFLSRLTPSQIAHLRQELVTTPRALTSKQDLLRYVSKLIPIFDRAFFYGSLERCIKRVKIYNREHEDGEFSKAFFDGETNELCVNIDAPFRGVWGGGDTYDYAAVVVHEMLHGFYTNYMCECKFCLKRARKSVNGSDGKASGHGPLFLTAMRQIEWVLQREFRSGERKFDCHIRDSLALEMRKSRWQPRRDQFERWGVEYFELGGVEVDGWEDLAPDFEEEEFDPWEGWSGDRSCVCAVM